MRISHEYLRDKESKYTECRSCSKRSQFVCIKCEFCYSCHWKKEELEKIPPYLMLGDDTQ